MAVATSPIFPGDTEMARRMRELDWSRTALGPVSSWPTSLKTTVGVLLGNRFPMCLFWGPSLININNDAYRPILGEKHPASLGASGPEIWKEIWHIVGPLAEGVLVGAPATWNEHLLLPMNRRGYVEETYFTFSYSPVPDDDGRVGGVLVTCQETTEQVQDARQLRMLQELSAQTMQERSAEETCHAAMSVLSSYATDIPFAMAYLIAPGGTHATLAGSAHQDGRAHEHADRIEIGSGADEHGALWPLSRVLATGAELELPELPARLDPPPRSTSGEPVRRALILPLARAGHDQPWGFLIAGVSPWRALDERYRQLFRLTADQIASAIANAHAHAEERRRADALAEVDRAKTAFFSNVSHEFRTPLTLMLGPLDDALASPDAALAGENLRAVHRNTLRLLKLVNALLDFARIEAGRAQACYMPVDLAAETADLASVFRSAMERGGLRFEVDCPKLDQPVYVDRDMWEKLVANLLSNAFKFTFEGLVRVQLRARGGRAELTVTDTGVGVAEHDLPRLFERFYRPEGTRARTYEGSGIGLALVHEIAKLHGGSVSATSKLGQGTTFTVAIPFGTEHLPQDQIGRASNLASTAVGAEAFVQEALRWLPDAEPDASTAQPATLPTRDGAAAAVRVLVADDNADMRAYLTHLLSPQWTVRTAVDGVQALAIARDWSPELVIADVMMPNLDGFGLLAALRRDASTADIPVIMLSARAGEESRVEGLQAGADDYLVKPFSARELVARAATHIQLARTRAETNRQRRELEQAREAAESATRAKDEFLALLGHELRNPLAPILTAVHLLRMRGATGRELNIIERQLHQLGRLVDDLLDVSRITRGKLELRKRRFDLTSAVTRGLEIASPLLEQRRQRLELDLARDGLMIDGDPDRLAQVVSNLITNAAKYSEPDTTISVSARRTGEWVTLSVRDRGIGLAPEMLGPIFDTFVQQPQALGHSKGGLGIGLAIVRSLVELHGGRVHARSAGPGQGSEFVVELPPAAGQMPDRPAPQPAAPALAAPRGICKRVLVVDDNVDAASGIAEVLSTLGHEVRVAHDGPTALGIAHELKPNVCLLDIGLPVMDGYELARRLREIAGLPADVRMVAITGYGRDADRRRTAEVGFNAHLVKPVPVEALARAVDR